MTVVNLLLGSVQGWFFPLCLVIAACGSFGLWRQLRLVRHTTLIATWVWSATSLAAVAGCEIVVGLFAPNGVAGWIEPLRFFAAVATFCPNISLLGAKRPQDGMWNFIVLSLWGVLSLPAAESFFIQNGQALEVDDLRAWFLWVLIVGGVVNLLPMRLWLYALLFGTAQVLLFSHYLPLFPFALPASSPVIAVALIAAAQIAASRSLRKRRDKSHLDRLWLDFRDLFGALWSLRVIERVNAASELNHWGKTLTWSGFQPIAVSEQEEHAAAVEQSLLNLLRRFVDAEWIEQRKTDVDLPP